MADDVEYTNIRIFIRDWQRTKLVAAQLELTMHDTQAWLLDLAAKAPELKGIRQALKTKKGDDS